MSRFVALFHDAVDPAAIDADISEAHFDYLRERTDHIVLAGGLRPDVGQPFCGALWIIEAADRAEAERLVEDDPYRQSFVWASPDIFAWGKAPGYGKIEL